MESKNNIIIGVIIVILGTIFQIYYSNSSEEKYNIVYEKMFVDKANVYFENIMLKKAQGLDTRQTFNNELNNITFTVFDFKTTNVSKNERAIFEDLKSKNIKQYYNFSDNRDYFNYYSIVEAKETCISCHTKYKVGEVTGGIRLSIPTANYREFYESLHNSNKTYILLNIIFAIVIVYLIIWFINKSRQKHIDIKRSQRNLEKAEEMAKLGHLRLDLRTNEITLSKNMQKLFGLNVEKLLLSDFIKNIVAEKDRKRVLRIVLKSFKEFKSVKTEFQIIRQNDFASRNVDCQITYILNEQNNIIVAIGAIQDVTDFIVLRNELSILKQAVQEAPISIVITNERGHIEYVNPSFTKVTGYTLEEILGKTPNILKSEYTKASEYEKLWEDISSGKTWSGTFKNINKYGNEFWELAFISPVFSSNSKRITKYIAVKEEITKELYLQKELKDKEELMIAQSRHAAMGEMISMIAHQWRQPATVISLCANNILVDVKLDMIDNETLLNNAQDIIGQTEYLSDTIDNFRNFFKPNKKKISKTVNEVVDEAMVMMKATLLNDEIEIIEDYKSNKKFITFDKELMQVLINIIKNAQEVLKYKNIQRKIKIKEYTKGNNVIIEICDNGGGIEEQNLNRIFEPYFTTKDEKNGTGLGLYMSKVIVEKHLNGNISVYNTTDGACFKITINIEGN